jgi:hypothetical protein
MNRIVSLESIDRLAGIATDDEIIVPGAADDAEPSCEGRERKPPSSDRFGRDAGTGEAAFDDLT